MLAGALPGAPAATGAPVTLFAAESAPGVIAAGPDGNLWFLDAFERATIGRITPDGVITVFAAPTPGSRPTEITAGPDGNLWFTDPAGNAVGRVTPGGAVTGFVLPSRNGGPSGLTAGPDGNLWFAEPGGNAIGRITPDGVLTRFPLPRPDSLPFGVIAGPEGNLWFLTGFGSAAIGRITPGGVIAEFPVPWAGSRPTAITAGPDRNLWFADPGGHAIGRITPGGDITGFPLPDAAGLSRLAVGLDHDLWFTVARATGPGIGRITPDGAITEIRALHLPGPLTTGPDGAPWFAEEDCLSGADGSALAGGAGFGRIAPDGVTRIPLRDALAVPISAACPHLVSVTAGPDGNLWFTGYEQTRLLALVAFIGRVTLSAPGAIPALTLSLNQTRFAAGQTMRLAAAVTPGADQAPVDAYIVAQLPGGEFVSLQAGGVVVPGIVPIAQGVTPAALAGEVLRLPLTGIEPPGSYQWLAALTPSGSLSVMDLIGRVAQYPFTVAP
jgi:streptogramin lyase